MKTIAWDIDDVLNDLMAEWFAAWKQAHPTLSLTYEAITCNPPQSLLGVSLEDYLMSLDDFRRKHYLVLKPNPDVLKWFESCGSQAHHIALSAVPADCAYLSAGWVMRHFGQWIRGFHFIPSARPQEPASTDYDQSKADFLRRVGGVDFFIDDSPKNVNEAVSAGVHSYLVSRPWNNGQPLDLILNRLRKDIEA